MNSEESKNIVIYLQDNPGPSYLWKYFINQEDEDGQICQVVLRQEFGPVNQRETLVKRLGRRVVGIQQKPELPKYVVAAAEAYEWIKKHYQKVIKLCTLLADNDVSPDGVINATELLVKCLFGNKAPPDKLEDLPYFEPGDAGENRMPVRCVGLGVEGFSCRDQHVTALNELLLSKFHPSIEHIICWKRDKHSLSSCSTLREPTEHIKTKEVCICQCPGDYPRWFEFQIHLTKGIIQYIPEHVPEWDEDEPIWVQRRGSDHRPEDMSQPGQQGGRESVLSPRARGEKPVGVQSTELRKYKWEDDLGKIWTCLVWKSFYDW
ncbi:unnamed protein product [Rhizoctonia solani]|uniref:Uncharacterized protein n=1 Tax=Rhizoctonia solani TaxID=456999 RepID=A0A8H3GET6_9AGAM|nr:unnamed protein product [Rhizoctonia solani]